MTNMTQEAKAYFQALKKERSDLEPNSIEKECNDIALAYCYFKGHGVSTNYVKALEYFLASNSHYELAFMYLGGFGTDIDLVKAKVYMDLFLKELEVDKLPESLQRNIHLFNEMTKNPDVFNYRASVNLIRNTIKNKVLNHVHFTGDGIEFRIS